MATRIDEQLAVHETGHALVGLAVGAHLESITSEEGVPAGSHFPPMISSVLVTSFTPQFSQIELRLKHLVAAGGMAGEIAAGGISYEWIAADDLERMRKHGLTELQIQQLKEIATNIVNANRLLLEEVWSTILDGIEQKRVPLVAGEVVNQRFALRGVKFADFAALNEIIPGPTRPGFPSRL